MYSVTGNRMVKGDDKKAQPPLKEQRRDVEKENTQQTTGYAAETVSSKAV